MKQDRVKITELKAIIENEVAMKKLVDENVITHRIYKKTSRYRAFFTIYNQALFLLDLQLQGYCC
jgi:hypothetical protein